MDEIYTQNWWLNVQPIVEHLSKICWEGNQPPALNMLEVGSFEGKSSRWFLENWLTHESSTLTCVDSWEGGMEHQDSTYNFKEIEQRFDYNLKPYAHKVLKVKGTSLDGLSWLRANERQFHAAYIDGGHRARDVITDLILSHELVYKGGLVICDDYMWVSPDGNPANAPKLAIDAFLHIYGKEVSPIHDIPNRVMCWIKN